jgi:O-methyltransferase domain/Dimerisation domain
MRQEATQVTPANIMQIGLGFWGSKTLLSAIELGLFSELAAGPLEDGELSRRLGLHERSYRDFFDALVAMRLLDRRDGRYANTAETAAFLVRSSPAYIGGMLEMANERLYPFWGSLTEGLRTGQPQNEIKRGGRGLFDIYNDPQRLRLFLGAMTGLSMGAAKGIATLFPWDKYKTFIDVGGAQGGVAVQVALAHPHLAGANFDLPVVQPVFEDYARAMGVSERLRFIPGDFFKDPIPSAEVLIMGHILHDWDLNEKMRLIETAYRTLPAGGSFIVFEALIDDDRRENAFGLLMSLNMLIETPGGFDYTGADCSAWMKKVGFRETRVMHLAGPDSMVIGVK